MHYQDIAARNFRKPRIQIRKIGYRGWEVTVPPFAGLIGTKSVYATFEVAQRVAIGVLALRADLIPQILEMPARGGVREIG